MLGGQVPAAFGEIDHSSEEVYLGYLAQPRIKANPDLKANARRDPDLRVLREAPPS